jgi:phospholipase C
MRTKPLPVLAALASLALAACGGGASGTPPTGETLPDSPRLAQPATGNPVHKYIKHIVVIIQENRSFENFFAGFPGANAPLYGYADGQMVTLQQITFKGPDIQHDWHSSLADWDNGKMDGFYQFGTQKYGEYDAYSYVERSLVQPYWDMAGQYVLADAMFPTEFGGSFTGHLTLVAGTDDLTPKKTEVDTPSGLPPDDCDSVKGVTTSYITPDRVEHSFKGPFPCFDQWKSIAQVLDHGKVSWKYYATQLVGAGMWEPFEAMKYVRYGPDWNKNIIAPQTTILTDPQNGQLAQVSWVSPSVQDSDHPEAQSDQGPSWVASVVNAVGESSYWKSSAIIVLWDDWGGWYDNAPPPQLDYRGLGIRVPCIIISPYALKGQGSQGGYVSHTQYEFGSILRFAETVFRLGSMHTTDARSNDLFDCFNFSKPPTKFERISAKLSASYFLKQPFSRVEPDDDY